MHHRARTVLIFVGAGLGLLTSAGCGGGGSNGGDTVIAPLSATLLAPAAGQSYSYNISGTLIQGVTPSPLTGVVTVTRNAGPAESVLGSVTGGGQTLPLVGSNAFSVDGGTGDVSATTFHNFAGQHTLTTPVLVLPGTFSDTTDFVHTAAATDDGTVYSISLHVIGREVVTVPEGAFTCWKATQQIVVGTTRDSRTAWYAPQIGTYVKSEDAITDSTQPTVTINLTRVLIATNVPH